MLGQRPVYVPPDFTIYFNMILVHKPVIFELNKIF